MSVGIRKMVVVSLCGLLVSCSTMNMQKADTATAGAGSGGPLGGNAVGAMDSIDRNKMFHALDNPPGKSTQWQNASTGVNYTVTPTKKVSVGGNQFCREYQISAEKNSNVQNSSGTACVGTDGSWKSM